MTQNICGHKADPGIANAFQNFAVMLKKQKKRDIARVIQCTLNRFELLKIDNAHI